MATTLTCTFKTSATEGGIQTSHPVRSFSYTLAPGIEAGTATVTVALDKTVAVGDWAEITFGSGANITLDDMRVRSVNIAGSTTDLSYQITVRDKRWRWGLLEAYSLSTGVQQYNARNEYGELYDDANKKNAQEIATAILTDMGVTFDVSDLPATSYPSLECGYENPATLLKQLCDRYSADIVLSYDGLKDVKIKKPNVVDNLPAVDIRATKQNKLVEDIPEFVTVVGSPTRVTTTIELEAVAYDIDGVSGERIIQPLTSLSYYDVTKGWSPGSWLRVKAAGDDEKSRLAKKSLFRMYRLPETIQFDLTAPATDPRGNITVTYQRKDAAERMIGELVQTVTVDGLLTPDKPYTIGDYNVMKDLANPKAIVKQNAADAKKTDVEAKWSKKEACIHFSQPLFALDAVSNEMVAPKIWLVCCFELRDSVYRKVTGLAGAITGTERRLFREDFRQEYYDATPVDWGMPGPYGTQVNATELELIATTHIGDWEEGTANITNSKTVDYNGIKDIEPDGAIQNVSWSCGANQEVITTASWGCEHAAIKKWQKSIMADQAKLVVDKTKETQANRRQTNQRKYEDTYDY